MPVLFFFAVCMTPFDCLRIVGLFPDDKNGSFGYLKPHADDRWVVQSMGMFSAAMELSYRYGIHAHGQPINYTRVRIKMDPTGLAELNEVCRMITDTSDGDVVGIVGPTTSSSIRFVGLLAAQIHVPIVSYATTHAEFANAASYQTMYRLGPSDILLAEAIVKLFNYASWKTTNMIFGQDDYGYGGLKTLSKIFPCDIAIKERIVFNPKSDRFRVDLEEALERSPSRIILVWADAGSSTRIIQHAQEQGLLDKSYTWLMTNQVHRDRTPSRPLRCSIDSRSTCINSRRKCNTNCKVSSRFCPLRITLISSASINPCAKMRSTPGKVHPPMCRTSVPWRCTRSMPFGH